MTSKSLQEWRQRGTYSSRGLTEDEIHERLTRCGYCFSVHDEQTLWSEQETIKWYQSLRRFLEDETSLEACLAIIASQWDQAEPHLLGDVKDIISEGVAELRESLTAKFHQHRERSRR